MARNKGTFEFSANFQVKAAEALDPRVVVESKEALLLQDTWPHDGGAPYLYNGLIVAVTSENALYMLVDKTNYNAEDYSGWKRIDAAAAKIEVVDSIESTDTTKALAASQGKVLADKIQEVKNSLSSVYTYKGSVTTFETLPTENVQVGDTYNVVNANGNIPGGTNYAWNGEAWDALGGEVDLSGYYTSEQVDNAIKEATKNIATSEALTELDKKVTANTSALEIINGDKTTEGSLLKILEDSKSYTDGKVADYVLAEEGKELISTEKLTLIDTNASDITALETRVATAEDKLQTLEGDENITGSVLNIVNTQITNALEWHELS